jgi:hypothetical protein
MTNPSAMIFPYLFPLSDDIKIPLGSHKSKDIGQNIFGQRIFKNEEFLSPDIGPLESDSIQKYAPKHVRKCGITKNEKHI